MDFIQAPFPKSRLRRLRRTDALRKLVSEMTLSVNNLIWPIFIQEGKSEKNPIKSMPNLFRLSIDMAVKAAQEASALAIPAICLFPYINAKLKSEDCREAWNKDNLINRAIAEIKSACPNLLIMTDVALDPYNIFGHDGIYKNGKILNDETIDKLVKMALAQAERGADILGPSDMMDGRVAAIRAALEKEGYEDIVILSYAVKYASAFYNPFRDAVGALEALKGDKKTYQMDFANGNEALRCVARDLKEGADMVMVKPGLAYLDICYRVKAHFGVPTFAYQVSGEYAMISTAIQNGYFDDRVILESLMAFRRAGCDGILTYFAPYVARLL